RPASTIWSLPAPWRRKAIGPASRSSPACSTGLTCGGTSSARMAPTRADGRITMKQTLRKLALATVVGLGSGGALAQTVQTRIGPVDLEVGYPTDASTARLFDEMDFQRATQAYLWALPAVG